MRRLTAILTIAFAFGTAAASAVAPQALATANAVRGQLTWHKLNLKDGWTSGQSQFGTGNPSWAIQDGIVYLSGSLDQLGLGGPLFAVLPRIARPAHIVYIATYAHDDTVGHLDALPDGDLYIGTFPEASGQAFSSLAGISFPAASASGRHVLNLVHGWTHVRRTDNLSYRLVNGVVHLSGVIRRTSGTNELFGYLPKAARPAKVLYVSVNTANFMNGALQISPTGAMYAYAGDAAQLTSLDGVSYPVSSAKWTNLALLNGWTSSQSAYDSGNPSFRVSDGVVYLSGSLHQAVPGGGEIAVLPRSARPTHNLWLTVFTSGGSFGSLEIKPNGQMNLFSNPSSDAQDFTSLAAIAFPLKS